MTFNEAKKSLKRNINLNFSHAVLLKNGRGFEVEVHGGHAGNCCCNRDQDFLWRETAVVTLHKEIDNLKLSEFNKEKRLREAIKREENQEHKNLEALEFKWRLEREKEKEIEEEIEEKLKEKKAQEYVDNNYRNQ